MDRKWQPIIAILALLLLAAVSIIVMLRPPGSSPPASAGQAEANALDPVRVEMDCIDRVLADAQLKTEEVQPALDRCRSQGASETRLVNSQ